MIEGIYESYSMKLHVRSLQTEFLQLQSVLQEYDFNLKIQLIV